MKDKIKQAQENLNKLSKMLDEDIKNGVKYEASALAPLENQISDLIEKIETKVSTTIKDKAA